MKMDQYSQCSNIAVDNARHSSRRGSRSAPFLWHQLLCDFLEL